MKQMKRGGKVMLESYNAPDLSDAEFLVLQAICRYYMLGKTFRPARAARYCGLPHWLIHHHLKSLAKRKVLKVYGRDYIPLMHPNGAPVVMPEIYFENDIKIIRCPSMYAEGYARMRNF